MIALSSSVFIIEIVFIHSIKPLTFSLIIIYSFLFNFIASVNISVFQQFSTSFYILRHLISGTWTDAAERCKKELGNLWSINSHAEWWHVSQILGMGVQTETELLNLDTLKVLTSTISFIGLGGRLNVSVIIFRIHNIFTGLLNALVLNYIVTYITMNNFLLPS